MRNYLLLFFCFISMVILAKDIPCNVYDINKSPLENVQLKNIKSNEIFLSNVKGNSIINGLDSDTILFTLEGYYPAYFTIKNIKNAQNKILLYQQMQYTLSEVIVKPMDVYRLYETSVVNLKKKLLKEAITYRCTGSEIEINEGEERQLAMLFSAQIKNADIKKTKFDYEFLLSELKIISNNPPRSNIMEGNNYHIELFPSRLKNKLEQSAKKTVQVLDSTIIIIEKKEGGVVTHYTINKSDSTLTSIKNEFNNSPSKKYKRRRTFSVKNINQSSYSIFSKRGDSYFLSETSITLDTSFLTGNPQKEERLVCNYKILAVSDDVSQANFDFKPYSHHLYKMKDIQK